MVTTDIFGETANYLQETSLVENKLLLKFKYDVDKVKSFSIKHNTKMKYVYDIRGGVLPSTKSISQYKHKNVQRFRMGQYSKSLLRVVIESSSVMKSSFSIKGKVVTIYLPSSKSKKVKVPIKATKKKRLTVIVDAGHGGRDRGAYSKGVKEKDVTLTIAKRLRRKLMSRGYRVLMTRTNDRYVSLKDRTSFANRHRGDIFISIHTNAAPKKRSRHTLYKGVEIFYLSTRYSKRIKRKKAIYSRYAYRQMVSRNKIRKSRILSKKIKNKLLKSVRKKYSIVDKGVKQSDFWVIFTTKMPAILIETGYLTNNQERRRLTNGHYQNLLVSGIANGVDAYFGK